MWIIWGIAFVIALGYVLSQRESMDPKEEFYKGQESSKIVSDQRKLLMWGVIPVF